MCRSGSLNGQEDWALLGGLLPKGDPDRCCAQRLLSRANQIPMPAMAAMAPAPPMGSRQQKVAYSQFSWVVRPWGSVRPKRRKVDIPASHRMAARMPRTMAITRQRVWLASDATAGAACAGAGAGGCNSAGSGTWVEEGPGAPHSPQNRSSSRRTAPQLLHWIGVAMISLSPPGKRPPLLGD